jgi:hypothetical protein
MSKNNYETREQFLGEEEYGKTLGNPQERDEIR